VSTKVPVGQKVIVKQLTGRYGHYIVHAQHFKLVRKSSTKVHAVTYTSKAQDLDYPYDGEILQQLDGRIGGQNLQVHDGCFDGEVIINSYHQSKLTIIVLITPETTNRNIELERS
jgi:hypothetical protein